MGVQRLDMQMKRYHNASISWRRQIKDFSKAAEDGQMAFSLPRPLAVDEGLELDLIDLESKSKVFLFYTSVWRLNHDLENVANGYRLLQENHWGGTVPAEVFLVQARKLAKGLESLANALEELDEEALDLWAHAQARFATDKGVLLKIRERLVEVGSLPSERVKATRENLISSLKKSTRRLGESRGGGR